MALRNGLSVAYRNLLKPSIVTQNRIILHKLSTDNQHIKQKIDRLVASSKVVVFMKGDPQQPRCGFSNAVVQVINY